VSDQSNSQARPVTTDELVAYHQAHSALPARWIAAAIPKAIDALYATRDAGGVMHQAGAAAAMATLEAIGDDLDGEE
jgi:hypothetical protein